MDNVDIITTISFINYIDYFQHVIIFWIIKMWNRQTILWKYISGAKGLKTKTHSIDMQTVTLMMNAMYSSADRGNTNNRWNLKQRFRIIQSHHFGCPLYVNTYT